MTKQIHIFATRDDILPNIKSIESHRSLKYVRYEIYKKKNVPIYESLTEYKSLGANKTGDHNSGDCFIVVDRETDIHFQTKRILFVRTKTIINQLTNPDSIVFQPGGIYKNKYLICGHIGTASDSARSFDLYKYFSKAIRKNFAKIESYYVGENALLLLKNGIRLITMGIDEPIEYDLKI